MSAVVAQMVVVATESVGGAIFLDARYYEDDGDGRVLISDRRHIHDAQGLHAFQACLSALEEFARP